jgi:phospholipid/cholesterol/gamma-HCH transport system permease protein
MGAPADFILEETAGHRTAVLSGDWTARGMVDAGERLIQAMGGSQAIDLDLRDITRCDTAGAYAIIRAADGRIDADKIKAGPRTLRLLHLVDDAIQVEPEAAPPQKGFLALLQRIGRGVYGLGDDLYGTLAFLGHLLVAIGRCIVKPSRIRWAPVVALAERAGLDAIPIVAVTTFFIGAVVALLGANLLTQFGAQVFAVELIGISVLREFNILITAILLAGRSASSFAAEIGSMKMNQEIDAMQVMGVDPYEALVLPRFAAMVIAAIGCRQGMEVGNDVESLGRRVTAAVVHAIFAIIAIDAVFALIYMELDI